MNGRKYRRYIQVDAYIALEIDEVQTLIDKFDETKDSYTASGLTHLTYLSNCKLIEKLQRNVKLAETTVHQRLYISVKEYERIIKAIESVGELNV